QTTESSDLIEHEWLTLATKRGLRSVPLHDAGEIQLADPALNREMLEALQVLAGGRRSDKKTITLRFHGEGRRTVRVGYVRETPVWKTSYRLVLDEKRPALLQGWAIVENTGESDWRGV